MAKVRKDKAPMPRVRLSLRGLAAASAFDVEELERFPVGAEFDLVPASPRSLPQHRTYWQALTRVVAATGRWQSREALHVALKVKLGRVEPIFDLQGRVIGMRPDSTAFDAMSHKEFCDYMEQAMAALAEAVGFDPLAFLEDGQ